ncbi:MAG: methylmalonyl Co-A mutase-associated GTPase MeaB [Anaerolineae bacterium]
MADAALIEQVLKSNPTAVARAISRVERGGTDARELIRAIFSHSGRAQIIGVTGPPGTGKSTLVNELAKEFKRRERKVAVIAVDPSSPFTGGAILGDRLRMQDLAGTGIFIRSMATRGQLGGLAAAVADAVVVLDVAGFDTIVIETVGAGQSEVDIAKNAHTVVVLEAPGLGDEIQAIKAGILEIADVLVVNKADRDGAQSTAAALEMNLSFNKETNGWRPPVLKTVAVRGEGITAAADAIEQHEAFLDRNDLRRQKERARIEDELVHFLQQELLSRTLAQASPSRLPALVEEIVSRKTDVYSAADKILIDV